MTAFSRFEIMGNSDVLAIWCRECRTQPVGFEGGFASMSDLMSAATKHWAEKHHHSLDNISAIPDDEEPEHDSPETTSQKIQEEMRRRP